VTDKLHLLVSGRPEDEDSGALHINQDAAISGGRLVAGTKLQHPLKYQAYILASSGSFFVNGVMMSEGDGMEVVNTPALTIEAREGCEILVIDVPELPV
jgi:redox-sensitive bicupin YhaK (pirin superfamily)